MIEFRNLSFHPTFHFINLNLKNKLIHIYFLKKLNLWPTQAENDQKEFGIEIIQSQGVFLRVRAHDLNF